jgi:SM-20-related protein
MFSHLEPYKDIFKKEGKATIPNIFPESQADEIWESYINHKDFKVNFYTEEFNSEDDSYIHYANKGSNKYHELSSKVYSLAAQDRFCYRFSRTSWVHPYLETLWSSQIFIDLISSITGYDDLAWVRSSTFTSKYEAGDFLYTHTDKGNGRIAFVYQLTKDWRPGYGGLFMKMGNWTDVDSTVIPKFNQLTIFDVANEGTPHIVTQLIPHLTKSRIAYSGWLA